MQFRTLATSLLSISLLAAGACADPREALQEYLENGDRYMAEGALEEAVLEYRNAVKLDENSGEARWRLGQAYESGGNLPGALEEYVRAADLLPDRIDVQVRAGELLLRAGQLEDAKARAERALTLQPQSVEARMLHANAMAGLKDLSGAIAEIEEALVAQPLDSRMLTGLGMLRSLDGETVRARDAFERAIAAAPDTMEPRLALAVALWSAGEMAEVEQVLNEAAKLDPSSPLLNRMLVALYLSTGRPAQAERPLQVLAATPGQPGSALMLADYYAQTGRSDEALAILKPMAEGDQSSGAAVLRIARIDRLAGRRDSAMQALKDLVDREPRNAFALSEISTWQLEDGEEALALTTARAAVAADAASPSAQLALGRSLYAARQFDEAARALREVLQRGPVVPAQLLLAQIMLLEGDTAAAAQFARDAKRGSPDDPQAGVLLAKALLAAGDVAAADTEVRSLRSRHPQMAEVHVVSAQLLQARGDVAGARAAFSRALERDPANVEAIEGLAILDVITGNPSSGIARLEQGLKREPENAALHFAAARTYLASGQPARAEEAFRRGLEFDPDNLRAYFALAQVIASQGRLEQALKEFDSIAERESVNAGPATMAAMMTEAAGRQDEALERYEAIVAAFPRASVAANNLAWLYAERGINLNVALRLAQDAKAQIPDSAEVTDTLGWVYYKQDLPTLAVPQLERAVTLAGNIGPAAAVYHYHLGMAYLKAEEMQKARISLAKALELNPSFEGAGEARKALASIQN